MKRSRRFLPVMEEASRREAEAARALGEARTRLQAARAQLGELENYRREYSARLAAGPGMGAMRLRDYHGFLDRLGRAIEQQGRLIRQLEEAERQCLAAWQALHARRRALGKVHEGYVREERRSAERQEQKSNDEQALLALRHRRGGEL